MVYSRRETGNTHTYRDEVVARRQAIEMQGEYRNIIAITRADATEFYEGEGL